MESDLTFSFTDLTDRLSEEDGAEFASNALQRLLTLKEEVDGRIAAGVAQDVYAEFTAVSQALGSARAIMSLLVKSRMSDAPGNST